MSVTVMRVEKAAIAAALRWTDINDDGDPGHAVFLIEQLEARGAELRQARKQDRRRPMATVRLPETTRRNR